LLSPNPKVLQFKSMKNAPQLAVRDWNIQVCNPIGYKVLLYFIWCCIIDCVFAHAVIIWDQMYHVRILASGRFSGGLPSPCCMKQIIKVLRQ